MIIKGININIIIGAILITIVIAIGIVSVSCEKEDNMSERFLLLTAHSWEHDTIFTICQNPEIVWGVILYDSAAKGSTVTYSANGSFVTPFESGNWKFSNEENEIITYDTDDPSDILGHVRIDVLTDNFLEVTDLAEVPPSDTCYIKGRFIN